MLVYSNDDVSKAVVRRMRHPSQAIRDRYKEKLLSQRPETIYAGVELLYLKSFLAGRATLFIERANYRAHLPGTLNTSTKEGLLSTMSAPSCNAYR